jgi:hypothetical protein
MPRNQAVCWFLPRLRCSLEVAYKTSLSDLINIFFLCILILKLLQYRLATPWYKVNISKYKEEMKGNDWRSSMHENRRERKTSLIFPGHTAHGVSLRYCSVSEGERTVCMLSLTSCTLTEAGVRQPSFSESFRFYVLFGQNNKMNTVGRSCLFAHYISETSSKISLKFGFEVYTKSCLPWVHLAQCNPSRALSIYQRLIIIRIICTQLKYMFY